MSIPNKITECNTITTLIGKYMYIRFNNQRKGPYENNKVIPQSSLLYAIYFKEIETLRSKTT